MPVSIGWIIHRCFDHVSRRLLFVLSCLACTSPPGFCLLPFGGEEEEEEEQEEVEMQKEAERQEAVDEEEEEEEDDDDEEEESAPKYGSRSLRRRSKS